LIPILVGREKDGEWNNLIGFQPVRSIGQLMPIFVGDVPGFFIEPTRENLEFILGRDDNFGKAIMTEIPMAVRMEGVTRDGGEDTDPDKVAPSYQNDVLNAEVINLWQAGFPDWVIWFSQLPEEEQRQLIGKIVDGRGYFAVGVVTDDPVLEALLQRYPLKGQPVGRARNDLPARLWRVDLSLKIDW
jgi:hypothetical protein